MNQKSNMIDGLRDISQGVYERWNSLELQRKKIGLETNICLALNTVCWNRWTKSNWRITENRMYILESVTARNKGLTDTRYLYYISSLTKQLNSHWPFRYRTQWKFRRKICDRHICTTWNYVHMHNGHRYLDKSRIPENNKSSQKK